MKKIRQFFTWNWSACFEWKVQDAWLGVFWKRGELNSDVWICLLPCLPLHIKLRRCKCPRCDAVVKRTYTDTGGIEACCIHCAWSPEGCRCRFGEFGKPETEYCPQLSDDEIY